MKCNWMFWSLARWLLLAAMLFPVAMAQGQCEPLPLPYTTDLLTGFQSPPNASGLTYPWTEGINSDNCWTGYLDYGGDEYYGSDIDRYSARGRFGFNVYVDGVAWPKVAVIAVKDSTHNAVAMLIAPHFETTPVAFRLTVDLERWNGGSYTGDELFWGNVDVGWVQDVSHPNESFIQTGSFAIQCHHLTDTSWHIYCLPVHGDAPAGGRFALRLRSKNQGPAQNQVPSFNFFYELQFKQIVADTVVCPPPQSADTIYITDSICQHSLYQRNGITLAASETADTGTRTFVLHDYEFFTPDSCLYHVRLLTLRVLPSELTFVRDSIFPGEAYTFFGRELTLAGNYGVDHGLNAYGCPVKDSLELAIRRLPPMACGAEIEVERTDYYLSQPTEVHLWTESEGTRYLWRAIGLTGDSTQRDAYVMLQPESAQLVRLEVERVDTVNHIYRGSAMDTTILGTYELSVPVEPQTRYLLEADASADVGLQVQGRAPESIAWSNGRLRATFVTSRSAEATLTFSSSVAANLSRLSLRRYCLEEDLVRLVAHILQPRIVADRERICLGDSVVLHAEQTDYYRWAMHPEDTTFDGCPGCRLLTVSPQTTTTYYLLTPGGTVADSVVIVVQPYPGLRVVADVEAVDFDNPVLTLEELSEAVKRVRWSFSDGGEATGRKVRWHFGNVTGDSLWVNVEGCTEIGCCSDTLLVFPISIVSVWFPNVFTPDGEMNNRFVMVTNQAVVEYEMTIYNRQGLLVARCTDAVAGWDGKDIRGAACQQGAYAYICEYRLAGNVAKRYLGTVLLLR